MKRDEALELLKNNSISKEEFLILTSDDNQELVTESAPTSKKGELKIEWQGMWMIIDATVKIRIDDNNKFHGSFKKGFDFILPIEKSTYNVEIILGSMKTTKFTLSELNLTGKYLIQLEYNNTWGKFKKEINLQEL